LNSAQKKQVEQIVIVEVVFYNLNIRIAELKEEDIHMV
jgi:hypothetical protein